MAQFLVTTRHDGASCVRLIGEIDLAVKDELIDHVRDAAADAALIEVDCSEVTFIDSSGLGALVLLNKEAQSSQKRLTLVDLSDAMRRLIQITGLETALDIRPRE